MKLILLELNEINFDAVRFYLEKGISLPGFEILLSGHFLTTKAESTYENLEPWIQWPSVHTGKTYEEHGVFRLGDFVNSKDEQFFEKIEKAGFNVGAISPMNASNNLNRPAYFIPDPWTKTSTDGSFLSNNLAAGISQAVNDNSQSKVTFFTISRLIFAFIKLANVRSFYSVALFAITAVGKSWRRALFLDIFLYEIHKGLVRRNNPDFSTLFLNAGAHIQHHYFFNSRFVSSSKLVNPSWYIKNNEDPFLEMLKVYDKILIDVVGYPDTEVIVATGLSQKPYEELKFYYRLKDHKAFLNTIGVTFRDVFPRMTRDFEIIFDTESEAIAAELVLSSIFIDNKIRLFDEIDNRGRGLFVVLTYPCEITKNTVMTLSETNFLLIELVSFVAIKNGEHQSKGFAYFSEGLKGLAPSQDSHVSEIHNTVLDFFRVPRK